MTAGAPSLAPSCVAASRPLAAGLAALAVAGLVALPAPARAVPICDIVHKKCYNQSGMPQINPDLLKKQPKFKIGPNNDSGFSKPGYGYGFAKGHGGPNWGYGAAALAGGMALGALAAGAASAGGDCYVERRRVEDEEGNVYVRRVRVCE